MHSRIHCVRTLLEDCLDAADQDGLRFDPEPWKCLLELVDVPSVQRECRVTEDERGLDYLHELMERVTALIEREKAKAERESEQSRRAEVRDIHAAAEYREQCEREAKYAARLAEREAARRAREDRAWFESNPLLAELVEA